MDQDGGIQHKMVNVHGLNMHIAEKGKGPLILFLHGFPDLWYTWRHQITFMSAVGYRAVAPDLRGYGDTDAPLNGYSSLHLVGDLIGLLDIIAPREEKVFIVGHDLGAFIAWNFCLFRPDRVRALINMSVVFPPRNPKQKPLQDMKSLFGDDYYICRFQEGGEMEAEFAKIGTERVVRELLTYSNPGPLYLPKGKAFERPGDSSIQLPSWLTEADVKYYTSKFEKNGFRGINIYRNLDLNWELTAAWTAVQVKVPVKFIVGDQDWAYNYPGVKQYIHNGGFKKKVPLLEEVVVLEGVGHFLHQEKPDEISKHIYDYFQKSCFFTF